MIYVFKNCINNPLCLYKTKLIFKKKVNPIIELKNIIKCIKH